MDDVQKFFRNTVPGYVFLLALLPWLIAWASRGAQENTSEIISALVSGIPIGVVLNWLYHSIWHIATFEQWRMRGREVIAVTGNKDQRLLVSAAAWKVLESKKEMEGVRDWIRRNFSVMHSLGGGIAGIVLAFLISTFILPCLMGPLAFQPYFKVWWFAWANVALAAALYRFELAISTRYRTQVVFAELRSEIQGLLKGVSHKTSAAQQGTGGDAANSRPRRSP